MTHTLLPSLLPGEAGLQGEVAQEVVHHESHLLHEEANLQKREEDPLHQEKALALHHQEGLLPSLRRQMEPSDLVLDLETVSKRR